MQNNYRVIVNGITITNSMLTPNSYDSDQTQRVLKSYFTQDGVLHEDLSRRKRAVIQFSMREHTESEHAAFMAAFQNLVNVPVTYWDSLTSAYKTANCKMKIAAIGSRMIGQTAMYNAMNVTLEEY